MYIMKEETKKILSDRNLSAIGRTIGVNYNKISSMIKKGEPCIKKNAYCLTKYLDANKEIEDYFIKLEK